MRNCLLLLICSVLCFSCETEGFDDFQKEAVFETNLVIDGEEVNIQAGAEGYVMQTGFNENISGTFDYFSEFANSQEGSKQLNFYFDDLPVLQTPSEVAASVHSDLNFALNFTGSEGIMLVPNLDGLSTAYTTEWSVGELEKTNNNNTLIPLPILRDIQDIPVQYNLEVSNGFKATMNGSFNADLTKSCNAIVQTSFDQSNIYFGLTAFTQSPLQIDWSNGESTTTATYSVDTEQVTVDVISQNCNFDFSMEITNAESLPAQIGFETIFTLGPATTYTGPGVILEYVDEDGSVFRSDYGQQDNTSSFVVDSIEEYELNPAGSKTVLLEGRISCKVFSLDGNTSKEITAESIKIGLAYQS